MEKIVKNLTGIMLVANPYCANDFYKNSLIIIAEDDEEKISGVILNRVSPFTVKDMFPNSTDFIHFGGSNICNPIVLHNNSNLSNRKLAKEIYFSMDADKVKQIMKSKEINKRIYFGYSQWAKSELKEEVKKGEWILSFPLSEDVFYEYGENIYKKIIRQIFTNDLQAMTGISDNYFEKFAEN